jgi:hypothetical protein
MAEVDVRQLARSDDRSDFGCGDIDLDRFFQRLLLRFAFRLALELRDRFGCVGVVVDAKAAAIPFYSMLGFRPLEAMQGALSDRPQPLQMFMAIRRISASVD